MAGLDWAALGLLGDPNWGFVVNLAPGVAVAGPPPVALGGVLLGLPLPPQAHTARATREPSTSTSILASRRDAPLVDFTRGPPRDKATSRIPRGARDGLLNSMRVRKTARSSLGSIRSLLRTWKRMHVRWYGPDEPVLPITPEKIEAVASQMCHLRYRSFANYLSAAKRAHVMSELTDGTWGDRLKMTGRECGRAILRGAGPAKQCAVFEGGIEAVLALRLGSDPLVVNGLIGPTNLVTIGAFFLLREIESSLILFKSIRIDETSKQVLGPPCGIKNGPQAHSVWRYWGCLCREGASSAFPGNPPLQACPYHAALNQAALIRALALRLNLPPGALPFFPTSSGKAVAKAKVVETFECMGRALGERLKDEQGRRRFTGHLLRVLGARMLAAAGIELFKIQLLARWKSPIIMRYAAEAPLQAVTSDYLRKSQKRDLTELISMVQAIKKPAQGNTAWVKATSLKLREIDQTLFELILREGELRSALAGLSPADAPSCAGHFVLNSKSGCWHERAPDSSATRCGWAFSNSPHEESVQLNAKAWTDVCEKCLPSRRRSLYRVSSGRFDAEPESSPE